MTKKEALRKIDIAIEIAAATGTGLCKVAPEVLEIAYEAIQSEMIREEAMALMMKELNKDKKERNNATN